MRTSALRVDRGMMPRGARVVAVSVAFNEEPKIGRVLDRFRGMDGIDVVVLDDGSTDRTPQIAREKGATVVRHAKRQGWARPFEQRTRGPGSTDTTSA